MNHTQSHIIRAMTIAGSDSGGGAGIQADLKTFTAFGVYGTSVITALTAQNTKGVQGVSYVDADFVRQQLNSVMDDIGSDAVKTGMLGSVEIIAAVADGLAAWGTTQLVVDPVMVAKGGEKLIEQDAIRALQTKLLPLASVVTPNIPEAEVLCGYTIDSLDKCLQAARDIVEMGASSVIIKGGHADTQWYTDAPWNAEASQDSSVDVMYNGSCHTLFLSPRVQSRKTHGTGCTFSAAIAASLAKGCSLAEAVATAKDFIYRAIASAVAWDVGAGHGPTNHFTAVVNSKGIKLGSTYVWQPNGWQRVTKEMER